MATSTLRKRMPVSALLDPKIVLPAIGFFATAAAVVQSKGIPIFCDVDESLHMDPKKIEPLITKRTVALAPTHCMGGVCDMGAIMKVAAKHRIKVIEDVSHAQGGLYKGKKLGTFGEVARRPHSLNLPVGEGKSFYTVLFLCAVTAGATWCTARPRATSIP
jgi:dTDP-4-amino-4,6-dideoxygalactose transaminase